MIHVLQTRYDTTVRIKLLLYSNLITSFRNTLIFRIWISVWYDTPLELVVLFRVPFRNLCFRMICTRIFVHISKCIELTCRDRASSFTLLRLVISSENWVTGMHQTVFSILRITRKGIPFDMSHIQAKKKF